MPAQTLSVGTWIDPHKALVIPIVLATMLAYGNWSVEAFIYLALHGTYSRLWLAKQRFYPDRRFAEQQPLWIGFLYVFVPLVGYYLAPSSAATSPWRPPISPSCSSSTSSASSCTT